MHKPVEESEERPSRRTARREVVEIVDISPKGDSVGKLESGKVIFVDGGLPGETALVEVKSKARKYNRGRVIEIIESSPERIEPRCGHFEICGGCSWQDLEYSAQLRYKKKIITDSLERLGDIDLSAVTVNEPRASIDEYFYRNKMEFSFNKNEESEFGFNLGMHHRGMYWKVFDVTECLLQSERSNAILNWFREYASENNLEAYDVEHHTGFLRFLMIREGKLTNELMINIVTAISEFPDVEKMVASCRERFPDVTTITQNMNDRKSNIAYGEAERILYGEGYIHELTLGKRFRVYANSFLQTNSRQTETLYQIAIEKAELQKTDRLFDLYCGAGTIGLCAADQVSEVIGVELEESAIRAANENSKNNGVSNTRFLAGGVRETLREREAELGAADVMIIDPPRAGMHPRAVFHAARYRPRRIVYVSCSPGAFARDCKLFAVEGYRLIEVSPVDMFPHTRHIELVGVFEPV